MRNCIIQHVQTREAFSLPGLVLFSAFLGSGGSDAEGATGDGASAEKRTKTDDTDTAVGEPPEKKAKAEETAAGDSEKVKTEDSAAGDSKRAKPEDSGAGDTKEEPAAKKAKTDEKEAAATGGD